MDTQNPDLKERLSRYLDGDTSNESELFAWLQSYARQIFAAMQIDASKEDAEDTITDALIDCIVRLRKGRGSIDEPLPYVKTMIRARILKTITKQRQHRDRQRQAVTLANYHKGAHNRNIA